MLSMRRAIAFRSLVDVVAEARSLLESGYESKGNWTLGEICDHLAQSIRQGDRGVAAMAPWPVRSAFFMSAGTMARATGMLRVPTIMPPEGGVSDRSGIRRLERAVQRYLESHERRFQSTIPFIGIAARMAGNTELDFHCWHCAHHLSFLEPAVTNIPVNVAG